MTPEQEHELTLLMRASQRGDAAAYETLLYSLSHVVSLYVRRRVGPVNWLDDVVQDVLISIHKSRHTWNPARPFAPWFYAVLKSRLVDSIRARRRAADFEEAMEASAPAVWGSAADEAIMARRDLAEAMRNLTPTQRLVIERLRLDEVSVKAVAAETGMTESNVKVTAHRGYAALRRLLSGMGYGNK